jgi:polar amino acid transport system substrate-binding protein
MTSHPSSLASSTSWRDCLLFGYLQEPPFCFRDSTGIVRGCDVEVAQALLPVIGSAGFHAVETVFADLLPGLIGNRWAMTTGLFVTADRRAHVDFSRPIWALQDGLLTSAGGGSGIKGYRSLAQDHSALLGVVTEQVQHTTALRLGIPNDRIRVFATQDEAASAVVAGRITAYASVAMAHRGYLATRPNADLVVIDVESSEQPPAVGAFAFAKGSDELRHAIDQALAIYLGSPEHRVLMSHYGFTRDEVDRVL